MSGHSTSRLHFGMYESWNITSDLRYGFCNFYDWVKPFKSFIPKLYCRTEYTYTTPRFPYFTSARINRSPHISLSIYMSVGSLAYISYMNWSRSIRGNTTSVSFTISLLQLCRLKIQVNSLGNLWREMKQLSEMLNFFRFDNQRKWQYQL